ncbi:adenylyltransferase and sulfurtransferase [Pedobacter suwonensis]|uniref:Molybdopterin-synthase adenylyltransferase n=1 Tax=Pedobacter suwonensis TaxID=332999 RepID=A0A1I0T2W1_9SPHI|nr:ThiF family adenylyltransferase [Pedobacter suwonensis]SFA46095.1 adenylyltransferase and sulfurtransferase [Pedobacter suwonensis]
MGAARYNRQIILKGFGEEAQQKLLRAKVLVIGAGGLGCPALQYLAAAGIGHIGIIDDDAISLSNLHRQILFTTADIGKLKVEVAAKRLQEMNPQIGIIRHPIRLQKNNTLDILSRYDYILDGTDNFESRYLISDACALLNKPLIFAAVSGFEGQLAIFNVPDQLTPGTNYRDLFPVPPGKDEVPNCSENGIIGVLPGILGTMAAAETIKLIAKVGLPLTNRILNYNLLTQEQYTISITHGKGYVIPKTVDEFLNMDYQDTSEGPQGYIEIDAAELVKLQQSESTILIDVRERHEVPVLDKQIFTQVPMSEFGAFIGKEFYQKNVVLICQHGVRSVAAAEAMQEKYGDSKKIYSLKGGIIKWRDHFLKS